MCLSYTNMSFSLTDSITLTFFSVDSKQFIILHPFDDVMDHSIGCIHAVSISGRDLSDDCVLTNIFRQDVLVNWLQWEENIFSTLFNIFLFILVMSLLVPEHQIKVDMNYLLTNRSIVICIQDLHIDFGSGHQGSI